MATTYTDNFHLGMQENTADKFKMSVITDNMKIIDAALGKSVPSTTETISSETIAEMFEGVRCGAIGTDITGLSDNTYGLVRAYKLAEGVYMQIAEYSSRKIRYYTSGSWGSWL
ncbi:MAG: hypothetical protein IKO47_08860 [Ruminococcus sp.]|nr:hypothetical protein [Ruminococcus sp.]